MRAITYEKYGGPEVLRLTEVPKPEPKANEILIEVYRSTVTAGDSRVRALRFPLWFKWIARIIFGVTKPKRNILGTELSGKVTATGAGVTKFKVNDLVFGSTGYKFGAHAEFVCLPEDAILAVKPGNVSFEQAATVSFAGLPAIALLKKAGIKPGQKVLVNGASGGIGSFAVQLVNYFGGKVTGVCSKANIQMVKDLGTERVIDYTSEDFRSVTTKFDVILDAVGKTSYWQCRRLLQPKGVFLTIDFGPGILLQTIWAALTSRKKVRGLIDSESQEDLDLMQRLLKDNTVVPVIDRKYSFDQIPQAHEYVDGGHKSGNVVVSVSAP